MNKNGPIIIIEDDVDDQALFLHVFTELGYPNKIRFFNNGVEALAYLVDSLEEPFIIFSDINMPILNGIELREKVHNNESLRVKCIPYLFFTTTAEQKHVIEAYSKSIQGFFVKPDSYAQLKKTIRIIIEYWQECVSPEYTK